ncbi:MAG: redoxin family protein [Acidobacteriota bacterium]|nr:redoxin family protein [Acidobacteriota bacterium]
MTQNNTQKKTGTLRNDQNDLIFDKGFSFSGYERDALFLNRNGKKYQDISGVSGIDSISDGRAAVFADFDNDGDDDVFMTTIQGQSHMLFRNNVGQENKWLRVTLEGGKDLGRDAYGSVVRVTTSAGTLTKIKAGGSGFLSQNDPRLLFGLGQDEKAQSVEVTWPNGKVEKFEGELAANTTLLLREGTGKAVLIKVSSTKLPGPLTSAELASQSLKIRTGQRMPDLAMKQLNGAALQLKDQLKPGRKLLVNFWATWCVPCATEMPELQRLNASLAANGVDLVGVSVDAEPDAKVGEFANKMGAKYPIFVGGVPVIEKVFAGDQLAVPLSVVLDDQGRVLEIISGFSAATQRKFAQLAGASQP